MNNIVRSLIALVFLALMSSGCASHPSAQVQPTPVAHSVVTPSISPSPTVAIATPSPVAVPSSSPTDSCNISGPAYCVPDRICLGLQDAINHGLITNAADGMPVQTDIGSDNPCHVVVPASSVSPSPVLIPVQGVDVCKVSDLIEITNESSNPAQETLSPGDVYRHNDFRCQVPADFFLGQWVWVDQHNPVPNPRLRSGRYCSASQIQTALNLPLPYRPRMVAGEVLNGSGCVLEPSFTMPPPGM
jgi:hypothetical protein